VPPLNSAVRRLGIVVPSTLKERLLIPGYAVMFLALWVGFRFLLTLFLRGSGLSFLAFLASVALTAWLASVHFARTTHRQFSRSERWAMILCCSLWVVLQECLVLYSYFQEPGGDAVSINTILFVVLTSIVVYVLVLWVGFVHLSRALVAAYLRRHPSAVA